MGVNLLVVINTSEYDSKMESTLQDKSQYVEVELDPSQDFKSEGCSLGR